MVAGEQREILLPHLNQPSDVSNDDWVLFTQRFQQSDGTFRCEITRQEWLTAGRDFTDTDLPLAEAVDHVVPRSRGGRNSADNLQPATEQQNLLKLADDDPSWSQAGFFDQSLNHTALRFSQNIAGYDEIRHYDHIWANQRVRLSQRDVILLLAWVVRSGKLMGGITAAFAINHAIIEAHGKASPRIRRVAILTHDTANREQYVAELGGYIDADGNDQPGKWEQWGITDHPPRVLGLSNTAGADLRNKQLINRYDIVVMCGQLLWEKNGKPFGGDRFGEYLAQFDLILVDEPHLAAGQADIIARHASCPVLGTTGTPHDARQRFNPERYVLLSTWTKQQSDTYDGSLKYLPDTKDPETRALEATRRPFLTVLEPDAGKALRNGNEREINFSDEELDGHDKQFYPVLAVAREVVNRCRDLEDFSTAERAPHRDDNWKPDLLYFAHGLIAVDGIQTAEAIADELNTYFAQHRARFPKEHGWEAICHHGGNGETSAKPLTEASPWLRSDRSLDMGIDANCARILVVDQQSREGTSNPLCTVVGIAKPLGSVIEPGQRLPRAMGAAIKFNQLQCAPQHLDQPQFITHGCWDGNHLVISQALDYLINMEAHLKALTRLDLFMQDVAPERDDDEKKTPRGPMTEQDKVELVTHFAELAKGDSTTVRKLPDDDPIRQEVTEWITEQFGGSERKREQAEKIAEMIYDNPIEASNSVLNTDVEVPSYDVLLREEGLHKVTAQELCDWVNRRHKMPLPVDLEYITQNPDLWLRMYEDDRRVDVSTASTGGVSVNKLARQVAAEAMRSFGSVKFKGDGWNTCNRFAVGAVKGLLGIKRGVTLDDKGAYNCPQSHHLIHQHWKTLAASVRARMIKERPELTQLRQFINGEENI